MRDHKLKLVGIETRTDKNEIDVNQALKENEMLKKRIHHEVEERRNEEMKLL